MVEMSENNNVDLGVDMGVFAEYKRAWATMEVDATINFIRGQIEFLQNALEEHEKPYKEWMDRVGKQIEQLVMEKKESVELGGVRATYYKPKRNTSWKGVAEEMNAPEEIVEKYTKYTKESVSINIKG